MTFAAGNESDLGAFLWRAVVRTPLTDYPGSPFGGPVIILGSTLGLAFYAIMNSELGGRLKLVARRVGGRTVYFVYGPGLGGIVLVFGPGLRPGLVTCDPDLIPPDVLPPGLVPTDRIPTELLPALAEITHGSEPWVSDGSAERAVVRAGRPAARARARAAARRRRPGGSERTRSARSARSDRAGLVVGHVRSTARTRATAPRSSAVLAWRQSLEALMFAGIVRLRQWAPMALATSPPDSPG